MEMVSGIVGIFLIVIIVTVLANVHSEKFVSTIFSVQNYDTVMLVIIFLIVGFIAWRMIRGAIYQIFFTATKAIYDAKNKTIEKK